MAYRPCMDCRTPTPDTRCGPCTDAWRAARAYGGTWQRIRADHLHYEAVCRGCGAQASEVDHIVSLRDGGTHDHVNLQSLCHSCHTRKTHAETTERAFSLT